LPGSPQVHDFNGGTAPNGLFWIVQIPDDAVVITDNTLTIRLENVPVIDQLQFPPAVAGLPGIPATMSFNITYTKSGKPRNVQPTSADPLSPFAWAGEMSMATNSGTFSVRHQDGSFSATGSFSSSGNFGEMGTERNGSFVQNEMAAAGPELRPFEAVQTSSIEDQWNESAGQPDNSPKFKARVPVRSLLHGYSTSVARDSELISATLTRR
jgi:hypothetical protein